ncbi:hypothetical protein L6452_16067 [Arctium lappa]|uniref:Uncharacterized protein n=1 Tax=Arctium lappa TaxID=4217 RepID=A0ACB9BZM2_ARCLA|nr:hypothetical protein L6452_16067 [Arctium lappa]
MQGTNFYNAKLNLKSKIGVVDLIRQKLNPTRLALFRETCFGHWLDLTDTTVDPILVHIFLQTQVFPPNLRDDEMLFEVGGHRLRFGREEFCLITALRFGPDLKMHKNRSTGFVRRVFPRGTLTVRNIQDLFNMIGTDDEGRAHIDDDSAVRICLMMIVELFFHGHQLTKQLPDHLLRAIDDLSVFNRFPWGSHIWAHTYKQMNAAIRKRPEHGYRMSLSGFLYAFKIWILETFPMASTFYILTTRMPRAVRWDRSSIGIVSNSAFALLDVSTPERFPRERLEPTPWEEIQEWYILSDRWFSSVEGRRPSKRSRVMQAIDADGGSESEGDDQPHHDTAPPSHAGISRAHEATSVEEPLFHAGHSPSFHREHSPAGHYQHSPHVDPYADRWAEFTRWKDDFYDYRTSHRTEHDDLERRLAEKWATERSEREATERRLAELERLTSQFSSFQIPGQQQGGQPSQPANTQHGFGSSIFGGPSQYTDNSSSSFLDEIFGPSSFVTPTHHMAHGTGASFQEFSGQSTGQYTQGQYMQPVS